LEVARSLVDGAPRLGWLIDGNPETPEIAVMLQDTGDQIVLTVPTKGMFGGTEGFDGRWFMSGFASRDDPDRTRYPYEPPRVLMFVDNEGPVVLVGCHAIGSRSSTKAGVGRIVASFAVIGARNLKYARINGMRSELPGLALWSGQRSVHTKPETDDAGRVQQVQVRLDSPSPTPLARTMNLSLRPTWRTSRPDNIGTFTAHDVVELETITKQPRGWTDHLDSHVALRELLVLSAWRHFGFLGLWVNREDDPKRLMSGETTGPRWSEVATHLLREHGAWDQPPRFLFTFQDIGPTGVRRWLRLRSRYSRAMQPLVAIADQKDAFWETRMVQSGIALEALGYQIELDRGGGNLDSRGQLSYPKAIDTVLEDMAVVPIDDVEDWKRRSRECHVGVKHADTGLPDALELANTLRENLLVLRTWLASRLGCPKSTLQKRCERDPLADEYVAMD
jgi:hypothetical protein